MNRILVTAFAALLWLSLPVSAAPQEQADAVQRTPVTALTVETAAIARTTRVQGVIESLRAPELRAHVSAEVVRVNVDEGDRVEEGALLALLDDEGFRLDRQAAEADIARLEALLHNLRRTLARSEELVRKKLTSESTLDDARSAVEQAEAQLAQARARLAQARYQLSHTRILAPFSGVVQRRGVSVGDYVNPMSPASPVLFQIVDDRNLRARLYFPESLARAVRPGMAVTLKAGNERLPARITRIRPMLEAGSRALHALADFTNTPGWLPGQTVTASVELARREEAVVVPEQAVVQRRRGPVVYRLRDGRAREVPVTLGIREDGRVEIALGLEPGDVIAVDGAPYLADGVPVTVRGTQGGGA